MQTQITDPDQGMQCWLFYQIICETNAKKAKFRQNKSMDYTV